MVEGSFKSFDPLAYYVNKVVDFDPIIVKAHKEDDTDTKRRLLEEGNVLDFDVFICINHHYHAFLLCNQQPTEEERKTAPYTDDLIPEDPFKIPDVNLVWKFELCYENVELRMYKIAKKFCLFKDVRKSIKTAYFIGRYKRVNVKAMQFAALRAAPRNYNALISDCVEFAKEFCICLLSYCIDGCKLEKDVSSRIEKASATGLSIERLSRQNESSGFLGNTFLGGTDISSLLGSRHRVIAAVLVVLLLFLWPIIAALVVVYFIGRR